MNDATQARQAKALENISHYMRDVIKVMTTINENIVGLAKILKDLSDTETAVISSWAENDHNKVAYLTDVANHTYPPAVPTLEDDDKNGD